MAHRPIDGISCGRLRLGLLVAFVAGAALTLAVDADVRHIETGNGHEAGCSTDTTMDCPTVHSGAGAEEGGTDAASEDVSGLLQHKLRPQATSALLKACTSANNDPYMFGPDNKIPCCPGLQECLGDWFNSATWSYRCLARCHDKPVGGSLRTCNQSVPLRSDSIWRTGTNSYSCSSHGGIRGDGAYMCVDANGVPDYTSIYVDMGSLQERVGCFMWVTENCQFSMRQVSQIDFDVEWDDCDRLWMAPLWTYSSPWVYPQGTSGEIDFVEECPVPHINTNLGCYSVNDPGCHDHTNWGKGRTSNGPVHMIMHMDESGNLEIEKCEKGPRTCTLVAYYRNYLDIVYPTSDGRDNPYKFISDVWNDRGGDGGWAGCRAVRNENTKCKFAVTNIKVTSNSNVPVFGDPSSSCAALNGGDVAMGQVDVPHTG